MTKPVEALENKGIVTYHGRKHNVVMALANGASGSLDLERALAHVLFDAFVVFQERQKKYGPNNIAKRREAGVIVRADDKLTRLARAYIEKVAGDMPDESIEDTWLDLLNYAAIGLILHRGNWPEYVAPEALNGNT